MRFLTANEEKDVERLKRSSVQEFRIGSKFVGVQYGRQRPKYAMFTREDITMLETMLHYEPDSVAHWLRSLDKALTVNAPSNN